MSLDHPRVSVIVPAYNAAATLDACIASVQAQDTADWELIVSDDGSTDATRHIAERWAERDARIRVLSFPNGGVSAARNRAAQAARGEFLAFLDADDRWAARKLNHQLEVFAREPGVGVCFTRAVFVSPAGEPTGVLSAALSGPVDPSIMLYGNPATTCSTIMVRRALFERVGGFDRELNFAEDLEWLLRAACLGGQAVYALDAPLTDYRCSPGGLSSQLERMHRGWETMLTRARRFAPELCAAHEGPARAAHLGYLARRAVRLRQPARVVRHYLGRCLRAHPGIVLREPHRLLFTFAASCALPLLRPYIRQEA